MNIIYLCTFIAIRKGLVMEITGTSNQVQNYINKEASVEETEAMYQIKLLKMQQHSDAVSGEILEDTAEISKEAMEKFMSERGRSS